ncbi:MAG: hypothetical protein GEV10_12550 [Streptosporangiales bacterium]|nr:hypothetical protein [Streptosporangiales bacterium]
MPTNRSHRTRPSRPTRRPLRRRRRRPPRRRTPCPVGGARPPTSWPTRSAGSPGCRARRRSAAC